MSAQRYRDQARLLLDILPEVAAADCFALHGGTAINLFVREMPRLSIDLDLTYLPIEDRDTTLANIARALQSIRSRITAKFAAIRVKEDLDRAKLYVTVQPEIAGNLLPYRPVGYLC